MNETWLSIFLFLSLLLLLFFFSEQNVDMLDFDLNFVFEVFDNFDTVLRLHITIRVDRDLSIN